MTSSTKGDAFWQEAEKALNRTTIFGFGRNQKYEDAAEAFVKAGNAYKLANLWESAGNAFSRAAECHQKLDSANDVATQFIEAANSFKRVNPVEAIQAFGKAIEIYNENGRFGQSARYYKEVAEIYEADSNVEGAISSYQQAANLFAGDNKQQNANQCLLKIANIASSADRLNEAADIFETIARESMSSRLGAYSAKGYFTQCVLCHMAGGDSVAARGKLEEFKGVDYSFPSSRECDLLEKLLVAIDSYNAEDFSQACADYDRISPLDPWKTSMLLKAKKHITAAAGEEGDVDLT